MSCEQLYNSCGHTKTQEALCDTPFVTLNCNIQIFERDISSDKVNKGNPLWLEMWRVNLKVKLVRYDNRWSCDVWSLRYILPNVTIWIAYSQKLSMCSLISAPIPPCHHFPSFPPLCPYWVISISPSTLIFQPNHPPPPTSKKKKIQLEITLHLQIPSRDIRYLSAPFREKSHSYLIRVWAEMAVMSPIIMTSVIRRAFDGLTVGRALHYCVKSKIIFGSCVTFFSKKLFLWFPDKKALENPLTFR